MEKYMNFLNRVGLVCSALALIGSIWEKDVTESLAWGVILMFNVKELVTKK